MYISQVVFLYFATYWLRWLEKDYIIMGKLWLPVAGKKMMPPTIAQELQEMFSKVIMALQYSIEFFSNVTKGTLLQELKGSTAFN